MIEEGLTQALRAATGATVYPSQAPEGAAMPFVVYREVDHDDDSVTFEIDASSAKGLTTQNYRASKTLANEIRDALQLGFDYTGGCVTGVTINNRKDLVDTVDELHWTRATYALLLSVDAY